jgi:hypothetical protein
MAPTWRPAQSKIVVVERPRGSTLAIVRDQPGKGIDQAKKYLAKSLASKFQPAPLNGTRSESFRKSATVSFIWADNSPQRKTARTDIRNSENPRMNFQA